MIYNFDIKIAQKYGVNEAIVIANFQHWIYKNKVNNKNFFDGHYWTYNSNKAFLELFPFWSEQNIKTILKHLKEKGVLITGNYNKSTYDRTLWYAFADEKLWIEEEIPAQKLEPTNPKVKTNQSISENQLIQKLELTNGKVRTNQPIPDNKPYNKPNNKNTYIKPNNIYADTEILSGWNLIAKKYQLPTISLLSDSRKNKLYKILTKYKFTLKEFFDILDDRINKSLFLQGVIQKNDGSGGFIFEHTAKWHSDFDFFLQESSFIKTMDNGYTDGVFLK